MRLHTSAAVCLLALVLQACGGDSPTAPTRHTKFFAFNLVDPDRCTCGNGVAQYTIDAGAAGPVEAVATWRETDAVVVVRLLSENFSTVLATSTASGTTARFSHEVTPGTYRVQVFLAPSGGGRAATYELTVTHP